MNIIWHNAALTFILFAIITFIHAKAVKEETRTLDQIYKAALKEGGRVILYAGGDLANSQDAAKAQFEQRFPGMTLDVVVDYSKFHGPRIHLQLDNNSLVPDVTGLQTLHDFPRWKKMGALMQYKPAGWNAIYKDYRDQDGFYQGVAMGVFSINVNTKLMTNQSEWPRQASDLLKPKFANGQLAITWPNDDDAVLFWFKQTVDKYGWDYMVKIAAQKPLLVRGTIVSGAMVKNGTALATMSVGGPFVYNASSTDTSVMLLPEKDPFVVWAQAVAIFKNAKHPEGAKLFLNWILDKSMQLEPKVCNWVGMSVGSRNL